MSKPGIIESKIKLFKELIDEYQSAIQDCEKAIKEFQEMRLRHMTNKEIKESILNMIKKEKLIIEDTKKNILDVEKDTDQLNIIKQGYIEDFSKGLYYHEETGDLISETPSPDVPEEAYIPKGGNVLWQNGQ